MATTRRLLLREALHLAADHSLEWGWLYLPSGDRPTIDTPCLLIACDDDAEAEEDISERMGFPQHSLDTTLIAETVLAARHLDPRASDHVLLESFIYYWQFDAWLPWIGALDAAPWETAGQKEDRSFYLGLGDELADAPCRSVGCRRGAITHGVFCRVHHFEMVRNEVCPFDD